MAAPTSATGSVLVARLDSAGDLLLMGPALRAVAASGVRLTLLCGPLGAPVAPMLPGVDEVMTFAAPWVLADPDPVDPAATLALVEELRARRFDQAIVLGSSHQSPLPLALLLRLAGVPFVAGGSVDYPGSLLDVRVREDDDVHEVERALRLVGRCGHALPPGDDAALRLRPEVVAAAERPADLPERAVIIHPGCTVPARTWAPERWGGAVRGLVDGGWQVVVTGGPGERALVERVLELSGRGDAVTDLSGRTPLPVLAAVLERAACLVVGNTGPAHLAAAVGCPVVSVFAPTVPAARWRPWGVPLALLGDQGVPCAGCRAKICPVAGHPCLAAVTTADVVAAVARLARPAAGELTRAARPLEEAS